MEKLAIVSISITMLLTAYGCDLDIDVPWDNPAVDIIGPATIQVLERTTNKAIEGADVYVLSCISWSAWSGCVEYSTMGKLTTNSEGIVTDPSLVFADAIAVKHKGYWTSITNFIDTTENDSNTTLTPNCTYVALAPKCTVAVSLKRRNLNSPYGDYLHITVTSLAELQVISCFAGYGDSFCQEWHRESRYDSLPMQHNHVIYLHGFGNFDNEISWQIGSGIMTYIPFYASRFDTAKVDIIY